MADAFRRYRLFIRAGLGLYALVCLAVFLYVRFPYDSVKYKAEEALSQAVGNQVTLGHVSPNLLGGFTIGGVEIKGTQVAKELRISPKPWDVFSGSLGFGFRADMASGTTEGRMTFPIRKKKTPMNVNVSMNSVDLAGFSKVLPMSMNPKGILSGELNLTTDSGSLDGATGNLSLNWKKGTLPLGMASLPFDALVFDALDFDGKIDKGLLTLEKADFTGQFSGSMNGSIRFSKEIKKSRLAMSGELSLPESIRKALGPQYDSSGQQNRFSLRGSIERPRFRMLTAASARFPGVPAPDAGLDSQSTPPMPERRQHERVRQEPPAPLQTPSPAERRMPDKMIPDEMPDQKDTDQEVQ